MNLIKNTLYLNYFLPIRTYLSDSYGTKNISCQVKQGDKYIPI